METSQLTIYVAAAALMLYFRLYIALTFLLLPVLYNLAKQYAPERIHRLFRRELRALKGIIIVAIQTFIATKRNRPVSHYFQDTVRRHGKKAMFRYEDKEWTFEEIGHYANQVAHYFSTVEKLQKGDTVALLATSCPQYVAIWLGLNKIGCITALINCNVKDEALRHAIAVANSKIVIAGTDVITNYLEIMNNLPEVRNSFVFSEGKELPSFLKFDSAKVFWFDELIKKMPTHDPVMTNAPGYFDTICYIYTSGTTGLPKPCVITSHRMYVYAIAHHYILEFSNSDVLYCTLPLYHSAGGAICVGQAIVFGNTIALRKSFSASKFWDDVIKYKCTIFHYVGELCRYLLAQPVSPKETQHSLRIIYGVGLRPQIWSEFVSRFRIPRVCECYGSTEGNAGFSNIDGKPGAIGFTSKVVEYTKQQYFIRVDMVTGEPLRGPNGLCVKCKAGEPGELVGKISEGKFSSFDGYLQKDATEKKYLRDVLEKGDLFFRTGDILYFDEVGYVYFVDRTGDTFRWKGENVSTTEVEGIMSRLCGDVDVAVLGVQIPGCEGRAGMACIGTSAANVDFNKLTAGVKEKLASFARPLFLRFQSELQITGTFKIMKAALKEDGFNVEKVADPLYFWNPTNAQYEPLNKESYDKIMKGQIRF